MTRIAYRPTTAVDYGQIENAGNGNILGDNNDATRKGYFDGGGSIMVYPNFNENLIVDGKEVIAVRVAHRQMNGGLANGWVSSYLRIGGSRVPSSRAYKQDGSSGTARTIYGAPLYKSAKGPWSVADLNTMASDHGAAVGSISPNTNNRWCIATDVWIAVVLNDAVPVPSDPFPANNATVASSSVNFSAKHPATQEEQPVQTIFQVAKDAAFTTEVKTFEGGLNALETLDSRSYYVSNKNKIATYTGLGPGKWFLRMKGRDYAGRESNWGATTSFTVSHPALPVPVLNAPAPGSTVTDPYGIRTGTIPSEPTGDRKAGIEFQFSKSSTFASGIVRWANQDGRFTAGTISYNSQPDPSVQPGLNGSKVSLEDPDQRFSQGSWYGRVRSIDPWGQVSAWSQTYAFAVSHKPSVTDIWPTNNQAFDQLEMPVTWKFIDPWNGDLQTAYRMLVADGSNNVIQDTGKVSSSVPSTKMNVGPNYLQQNLYLQLYVWDLDDVMADVPVSANFFMSTSPIISLTFPGVNEVIVTGQPDLAWTVQFSRANVVQKSYQVRYIKASNLNVAYDSGVITTPNKFHVPPSPILENLENYQLQLTVTDSDNLSRTLKRNFSTNFIRPTGTQAFVDAEFYEDNGYVTVLWGGEPDPFFIQWNIYRRRKTEENSEAWVLAGFEPSPDITEFRDWLVAGSGEYEYAVNQVAYRFGSRVESAFEEYPVSVFINSEAYWFIVPDDESFNTRFYITADKFTDKEESNSYVIIGRGVQVNKGANIGIEGSLSMQIRPRMKMTARAQMELLRRMKSYQSWVLMRDPFGNVTKVALGETSYDRIAGTGQDELADVEMPYQEVR